MTEINNISAEQICTHCPLDKCKYDYEDDDGIKLECPLEQALDEERVAKEQNPDMPRLKTYEKEHIADTLELVEKLDKEIKKAAKDLGRDEARYLVKLYYQMQRYRIASNNQVSAIIRDNVKRCEEEGKDFNAKSHAILGHFSRQFELLEKEIKGTLATFAAEQPIGRWLLSIKGIGPVIAAGLIAHIDIKKCETAGAIWKFAGLDPTVEWSKGEKRPWNAELKVICWKAGQSFIKTQNLEGDVYGHLYAQRKRVEIIRNKHLEYKDQAEEKLRKFNIGKNTEAYKYYIKGELPPGHINQRAARWATKLFLAHLFEVWYRLENKKEPPMPYPIAHLGHVHRIEAPAMPEEKPAKRRGRSKKQAE